MALSMLGSDLAAKRKRKRNDYGYFLNYRLRWNDNDIFGHLNNPYYGVLCDSIINQYMIEEGGYKMDKGPQAGIIANTYFDYFGEVQYPGELEVGMRIPKLGKASVMYEVGIFKKGEENVKAVGGSTHVFVEQANGKLGRPHKDGMPKEMKGAYERLIKKCQATESREVKESKL